MNNKTSFSIRLSAFSYRLLALCIVHSALCISTASAVTITASATAVGAGDQTPITANVSGGTVDSLRLVYRVVGSANYQETWNTDEMTSVSAEVYTGYLPPLSGAVNVEWYVTDGTVSSATTTSTLAAVPDYNRYHDGVQYNASTAPYGWQQVSGTNYVAQTPNGGQWKASGVNIATKSVSGANYINRDISMAYPTIYIYNLPLSELPFIRSPKLFGGVGTIDFRTKLVGDTVKTTEITVQIARTQEEPSETDWETIKEYNYGTENGGVMSCVNHIVLNDYGVTYVRIVRTGYNYFNESISSGRFSVDNICITKPAADVGIIEKLKNPGYPAADQNILMRCAVTNVCEDTPAINRRVSVHYQYVARDTASPVASSYAWSSADMAYKGKDDHGLDWYEGTIPTQKVGYVWYYYQVDYDGYHYGDNPLTGTSESISPAYWNAGKDTHVRPAAGAKFQVRPYRSRYGRVALEAFPTEASIPEMTLVDNEQWQAVVPVSGLTVVSNYFLGYGYYVDDAEAYETNPVLWGENNPDALSDPTRAGFLESSHDTTVTNELVTLNEKDYRGFYLYRFSSNDLDEDARTNPDGDRRYDYIVKKAVYQDFDDWTASPTYYEASLGGLPTLTFTENFDGNAASAQGGAICVTNAWEVDEYAEADTKDETFQNPENVPTDEFYTRSKTTPGGFRRTDSRILVDRKAKNTDTKINQTMALNRFGMIENTQSSLPDGLEKITFKARASIDDRNFAVYKNGTAWTLPQYISARVQLSEKAPSKPYISFVFLYQREWEGDTWYELRLVQTDSANANGDTINAELWRHTSQGAETKIAQKNNMTGYKLEVQRTVNILVEKDGNTSNLRVRANLAGASPTSNTQVDLKHTGGLSGVTTPGGTIGFGVFDAVPSFDNVKVGTAYGGTQYLASIGDVNGWYNGGQRDDNQPRWSITSSVITRTVAPQTIGIYAADCVGGEEYALTDQIPETPTFTRSVNSLTMTDVTVDFKAWNQKFVQISYDAGDGGIVLDDIKYFPWRAKTRCYDEYAETKSLSYLDWETVDQQNTWVNNTTFVPDGSDNKTINMKDQWAVLEGWVNDGEALRPGTKTAILFDRSRANTNLVQGVVSPQLENGIGSCSFSYTASGGKVVYGIERTDRGTFDDWTAVAVYTNAAGDTGERYAKVGKYFSGRIRVRLYGSAEEVSNLLQKNPDCGYDPAWGWSDGTAKLLVDNLRVKDYPEDKNDNAWNAYNLLITDDKDLADAGLIFNNAGKSCFFNNSTTAGVYGIEEMNEDDPYLESPPLTGVGVGEIALQYRIVPGTAGAGTDGHLIIKVAPRRDAERAEWKTITNLVVSASGTAFVKFDNEKIFDENNFVVRFYNSTEPGTARVVIDNVLVTAPARPSFEFEYVRLLPEQPLSGTNTMVEAKIMREILNPKNVEIYLSYHKFDTNDVHDAWGVDNWFNPLDGASRIQLESVGEKIYRTPEGHGIPAFDANDIVEFVVWGAHADINWRGGESPIKQGRETFQVPAWYRTVRWNSEGHYFEDNGFVPMDINFPTNGLWIDNINPSGGWSPYFWVFSCPPGTFFMNEVNYWRTGTSGSIDYGSAEYIEFAGHAGTDIGGWKLMTVHNVINNIHCDMEYTIPSGTHVRANGPSGWGFFTWGDACSSDSFIINEGGANQWTHTPFTVDAAFPDSADRFTRNLGAYAGVLIYRPNGMIEECIRFGTETASAFNGEDDIWGGKNNSVGKKTSGKADSVSRISPEVSEESDERLAGRVASDFIWELASQTPTGVNGDNQIFAEVGGDTPVVVALYDPEGNEITDQDVLDWIEKYEGTQEDIDALGTMDKFNEEFLLDLDLTKTCVAELKITSIRIEDGYVYIGVQLTRTENNVAVGTRKINGVLKLLGRADLTTGAFAPIEAQCDDRFEYGNTTEAEYALPGNNPPKFFKAVIVTPAAAQE